MSNLTRMPMYCQIISTHGNGEGGYTLDNFYIELVVSNYEKIEYYKMLKLWGEKE